MPRLIVIPTQFEIDPFVAAFADAGLDAVESELGRLPVTVVPQLDVTVAVGGFGKSQFAVQTQHLIDAGLGAGNGWSAVLCAGAAGALAEDLAIGDVVVATETIEHDIKRSSGKPHPRFSGSADLLDELRAVENSVLDFDVHFAAVASGDEDVNSVARRTAIQSLTGAKAVAWEGAGGARASEFSGVPFLELRGITDLADHGFSASIQQHLPKTMRNIASLVTEWCS